MNAHNKICCKVTRNHLIHSNLPDPNKVLLQRSSKRLNISGIMHLFKNPNKTSFVFQQKLAEICIGKDWLRPPS